MTLIAIISDGPRAKPTAAGLRRAAEIGHYDPARVEAVLQDTWGHLKAETNRIYDGYILFSHTCNREIVILDWQFEDLCGGPWLPEHMMAYIESKVPERLEDFRLWKFEGTYRELKNGNGRFSGKVRPMRVQHRFTGPAAARPRKAA